MKDFGPLCLQEHRIRKDPPASVPQGIVGRWRAVAKFAKVQPDVQKIPGNERVFSSSEVFYRGFSINITVSFMYAHTHTRARA